MLATEHQADGDPAASLVNRIAAGERHAEQELVQRFWRGLFFVLNCRAQDKDLANDIAQDTFVLVINKARKAEIDNPEAISRFIRRTGVNLLIAHYRKEQRHKTDAKDNIQVTYPDPEKSLAAKFGYEEMINLVKQVMNELPAVRDKDLLYRFFVYGQSKDQVCREFDLTPEHFDRVLHRARSRLKQLIEVKLKVDLSCTSISQLLSFALASGLLMQGYPAVTTPFLEQASLLLRDFPASLHLSGIAVKDRPSYPLALKPYQQETR